MGHIWAHINVRPKGGLPTDIVTNTKSDAHVMDIFTGSGKTLGKYVIEFNEDPNKNKSGE